MAFFAYVARTRLGERIVFADNYRPSEVSRSNELVQVIDPVTPTNNVGAGMTSGDRDVVLQAAQAALDSVAAGSSAPSKNRGVLAYRDVFGSSFDS